MRVSHKPIGALRTATHVPPRLHSRTYSALRIKSLSLMPKAAAKELVTSIPTLTERVTNVCRKSCQAPISIPKASEILGHSDVHTTLRVYQHVETEDFRAPLNELADELLRDVTKSSLANPCKIDSKGDGAEDRN